MADPLVDNVLALVADDGNVARLLSLLGALNERQRKALAPPVLEYAERVWCCVGAPGTSMVALAVLGCVGGVRQAATWLDRLALDPTAEGAAVEVVLTRRPHWWAALPEALLSGRERSRTSSAQRTAALTEVGRGRHTGTSATVDDLFEEWVLELERKGRSPSAIFN